MTRADLTGWEIDEFGMRKGTRKIDVTLSTPDHRQSVRNPEDTLIFRIEETAVELDVSDLIASLEPFKAKL